MRFLFDFCSFGLYIIIEYPTKDDTDRGRNTHTMPGRRQGRFPMGGTDLSAHVVLACAEDAGRRRRGERRGAGYVCI